MAKTDNIYLYGPPGSGKSTLGKILAERCSFPFVDLDAEIVRAAGVSIKDIFAAEGEAGFRAREYRALQEVACREPCVVALGGGALLAPECRKLAEETGRVIFLECSIEALRARIAQAPGVRPLVKCDATGAAEDSLGKLMMRRAAHYASFPMRVDVSRRTPGVLAEELVAILGKN